MDWEYPDHYERLTADKMNNEAAVNLAETILDGIRQEADSILPKIRRSPRNTEYIGRARMMYQTLSSPYVDALSFGHGEEAARSFYLKCPRGVLDYEETDEGDSARKDDPIKRKARSDIGKPRKKVGSQSSAAVDG